MEKKFERRHPVRGIRDGKPVRERRHRSDNEGDSERPRRSYSRSSEGGEERPHRSYSRRSEGDSERPRRSYARSSEGGEERPHRSYSRKSEGDSERPRRSYSRSSEGGEERPHRSYSRRSEGDSERPRRSYARSSEGGEERPHRSYSRKSEGDSERPRRSYARSSEGGDERPHRSYSRRSEGDSERPRRSYARSSEGGDERPRRSYFRRSEGDSERPRRSYSRSSEGGDERPHRSYSRRSDGDSERPRRSYARSSEGGDERPHRSYSRRSDGDSERPRRSYSSRVSYSENRSFSEKKSTPVVEKAPSDIVRLNKFISNSGICSRREADEYIQTGLVTVNGEIVTELGTKVNVNDDIRFNGERLKGEKKVYIIMNKPKDVVTTVSDPHADETVMDLISADLCPERVYPVGRLDKATTGVLLFTNDGEMAEKLVHPSYGVKKIYHVFLESNLTKNDFDTILNGIELEDGEIHADALSYVDDDMAQVGIEIHSGRNRIVRRIFESLGYKIKRLDRVYFAGLTKKNLRRGAWRFLTDQEIALLKMGNFE